MAVFAQSCYNDNRGDGLNYMKNKQYDKAIRCFNAAKNCPDRPAKHDLDKLIEQCFSMKKTGVNEKPIREADNKTPEPAAHQPLMVNNSTKNFEVKVPPTSGSQKLSVKSPSKFSVTSDKDWCVVTEQTNTGFKYDISANTKPRSRKATLKITCGDESITVGMTQEANIPEWAPKGTTRKISSPAAEMPAMLEYIRKNPSCRLGGLTANRRGIVVDGNGEIFMTEELPETFKTILGDIKKSGSHIDAIAMTGSDYFCVVWDGNKWKGKVPEAMGKKLNGYLKDNSKIIGISISDDGNFVILTDKNIYASRKNDMDLIIAAEDNYGQAKSIYITTYGICVICEYGIMYRNIPENLASALRAAKFRPDHITYTDGGTYILMKKDGQCEYNIR